MARFEFDENAMKKFVQQMEAEANKICAKVQKRSAGKSRSQVESDLTTEFRRANLDFNKPAIKAMAEIVATGS